jgi:excisionase family DNA binding protein
VPANTEERSWPKPPLVHPSAGKWKFLAAGLLQVPKRAAPLETLLSVREVAAQLSVSPATVYQLCAKGQLRAIRVSNSLRICPGDLKAYVEASRPLECAGARRRSAP